MSSSSIDSRTASAAVVKLALRNAIVVLPPASRVSFFNTSEGRASASRAPWHPRTSLIRRSTSAFSAAQFAHVEVSVGAVGEGRRSSADRHSREPIQLRAALSGGSDGDSEGDSMTDARQSRAASITCCTRCWSTSTDAPSSDIAAAVARRPGNCEQLTSTIERY